MGARINTIKEKLAKIREGYKSKSLGELIIRKKDGEIVVTKSRVKKMPRVYYLEDALVKTADEMGLKWKNGRLVNEEGKLTKEQYMEFKKRLRDENKSTKPLAPDYTLNRIISFEKKQERKKASE